MRIPRPVLAVALACACGGAAHDDDGDTTADDTTAASTGAATGLGSDDTTATSTTNATTTGADTGVATTGGDADAAFTIVPQGNGFVATATADPSLGVEIDCDDEATDGRFFGIAPVIAGVTLDIPMYGGPRFPMFTPDFDAGTITCVVVESDATRLLVRLEAGSYQMLDPAAADEPVPLEVEFRVQQGRLVASATGIFYMMLSRASTTLTIEHGAVDMRTITTDTAGFTEDFDGVTRVVADDSIYGAIAIDGDIARLQLQLYDDGSEGFELDLDHAFKDLGQMSVSLTLGFG